MNDYIKQIEIDGFCKIPQVYDAKQVSEALTLAKEWQQKTIDTLTDNIPFLNRDQAMVYNLERKDIYFLELILGSPLIEEILIHFLNDKWYRHIPETEPNYILRSYLARSSNGSLPLHIDSFMPYINSTESYIMQVALILEDQNEENGCTIVMPGSHRSGEYADRDRTDETIPIISKAGDVVIWDSRLWHGTLANTSDRTRWALIGTFSRWWIKQAFNTVQNFPEGIYQKLTDKQKAVLGFCSIPYNDETEGIDMKRGYASLRPSVLDYQVSDRHLIATM